MVLCVDKEDDVDNELSVFEEAEFDSLSATHSFDVQLFFINRSLSGLPKLTPSLNKNNEIQIRNDGNLYHESKSISQLSSVLEISEDLLHFRLIRSNDNQRPFWSWNAGNIVRFEVLYQKVLAFQILNKDPQSRTYEGCQTSESSPIPDGIYLVSSPFVCDISKLFQASWNSAIHNDFYIILKDIENLGLLNCDRGTIPKIRPKKERCSSLTTGEKTTHNPKFFEVGETNYHITNNKWTSHPRQNYKYRSVDFESLERQSLAINRGEEINYTVRSRNLSNALATATCPHIYKKIQRLSPDGKSVKNLIVSSESSDGLGTSKFLDSREKLSSSPYQKIKRSKSGAMPQCSKQRCCLWTERQARGNNCYGSTKCCHNVDKVPLCTCENNFTWQNKLHNTVRKPSYNTAKSRHSLSYPNEGKLNGFIGCENNEDKSMGQHGSDNDFYEPGWKSHKAQCEVKSEFCIPPIINPKRRISFDGEANKEEAVNTFNNLVRSSITPVSKVAEVARLSIIDDTDIYVEMKGTSASSSSNDFAGEEILPNETDMRSLSSSFSSTRQILENLEESTKDLEEKIRSLSLLNKNVVKRCHKDRTVVAGRPVLEKNNRTRNHQFDSLRIKCELNPDCDCFKYWKDLPLRPFLPYDYHNKLSKGTEDDDIYLERLEKRYGELPNAPLWCNTEILKDENDSGIDSQKASSNQPEHNSYRSFGGDDIYEHNVDNIVTGNGCRNQLLYRMSPSSRPHTPAKCSQTLRHVRARTQPLKSSPTQQQLNMRSQKDFPLLMNESTKRSSMINFSSQSPPRRNIENCITPKGADCKTASVLKLTGDKINSESPPNLSPIKRALKKHFALFNIFPRLWDCQPPEMENRSKGLNGLAPVTTVTSDKPSANSCAPGRQVHGTCSTTKKLRIGMDVKNCKIENPQLKNGCARNGSFYNSMPRKKNYMLMKQVRPHQNCYLSNDGNFKYMAKNQMGLNLNLMCKDTFTKESHKEDDVYVSMVAGDKDELSVKTLNSTQSHHEIKYLDTYNSSIALSNGYYNFYRKIQNMENRNNLHNVGGSGIKQSA